MSNLLLNILVVFFSFWVTTLIQGFVAKGSIKAMRVTEYRYRDQATRAFDKAMFFFTLPIPVVGWLGVLYSLNLFDVAYVSGAMFLVVCGMVRTLSKTYGRHIDDRFTTITFVENGKSYFTKDVCGELSRVEKDMLVAGVEITSKSVKKFEKG